MWFRAKKQKNVNIWEDFMRHFLFATTALVSTIISVSALAQDAAKDIGIEEIVVTARQREERLIDVPVPVSVATAEQLSRDKVYSITDLQRTTPALEISQTSGGEVNGGARLRGLGTGAFNASVSPSVAFVVDQVPQGNLTFPILFDMAQVEVLRGPQGTLFGQGSSAGVINIITKAPTISSIRANAGLDYSDKGTAGSEVGEIVARGGVNLPLGDKAAVRFAVHYKSEKGLQRNTFLGLDNKINELGLRLRALLEPSEDLTINLTGEYAKQTTRGWNFFAIAIAPTSTAPFDPDGPGPTPVIGTVGGISTGNFLAPTGCNIPVISTRAEFYCEENQATFKNQAIGGSGRIAYKLSDTLSLTSVTAYRTLKRQTFTVNFSRRLGVGARTENQQDKSNQFSQELRLNYDADRINVVGGALYSKFNLETTPIDASLPFGNPFPGQRTGFSVCLNAGFFCVIPPSLTYEKTSNSTKAVFADATYSIVEQLDIFGGLRYSNYNNTTGTGANTVTATRTFKVTDNNLSGRIGLSYKPNSNATVYASFARGYKPSANVVPTIATDPVIALKPEKSSAFEVGGKVEIGRLQLSANAFYTDVKNFQIQSSVFNNAGALISVVKNITSVKSKGFELGAFGRISENLSINAGYQFNDIKFPTGFVGDDGVALGGTQFLNAPKHKLTFSGDFGVPVSEGVEAFTNVNFIYKSDVLLAQRGNPLFRYPSHAIINGSIGVREPNSKWKASIFVRNLTKQREPTAYLASDFAGNPDGGVRAWPVAGLTARVVGLSAEFSY
jgi:iron complex outermembrane recepter protein